MALDGPSGVPPGLRGAEFLQDLTGVRPPVAEKLPGSANVPGMGAVAVKAQALPVREGGQPSPVQAARSPATQSGSSIGQKILQALKAVWNYFMAPSPPAASRVQLGQAQAPQRASAGASAINAGWTQAPATAQAMALSLVQAEAGSRFREFVDGGAPTGAHEVFWKDLNRANYTVQLADGASQRIEVKDESGSMAPQDMSQRKMASIDQVRQLAGGDEALLRAATKMAHQGLASALQNPFMPSAPGLGLVMPDGSRGVPMASGGAGTEASYALSAGPGPGEISIRAEYSVRSPDVAFTDRGMLRLDPERSGYTASISIAVSVDAQGTLQVRMTEPLRSEYLVALAPA